MAKVEQPETGWTDKKTEEIIGTLLRVGVALSACIVGVGGALYLAQYGGQRPPYQVFHGEPTDLRSISGVLHFAMIGHRRGIIQAGLLLLIATPIARVIFSVFAFAREKDRLYVGITLIVLVTLLYSLFQARA
jgi:uncharacterized membrane protein